MERRPETTLYYSPGACSLAPHIVLAEIGEPFALKRMSTAERANYSPEYLAINPRARIPALAIDGFVLTENPAILAYLGRRFPRVGLYPQSGEAEARCLEWLAWLSNTVHVAYAQVLRPERFVNEAKDYPPVQASGRANILRLYRDIEERLAGRVFALGSRYSVVDPFLLVFYRWGNRIGLEMRADYPAWTRLAQSLAERPAVQQALTTEGITIAV